MKLCILGGTGFLGRHLCVALHSRGLSASSISRNPDRSFLAVHAPNIKGIPIETEEANAALRECDVLIHLASTSLPGLGWNNPAVELLRCAVPEVKFFQEFAHANPRARIIYASSGGQIYGHGHTTPIPDGSTLSPRTAYAFGKQIVEAALGLLSFAEGNPVTILRLANPIGQWQLGRKHGLVSTAIAACLAGKTLILFGEGSHVRDYFDADDFATFLVNLAQASELGTGTFNIGSGQGLTEREVIAAVSSIIEQPLEISIRPARPFDLDYAVLDCRKAQEQLNWSSTTSFETSAQKIIAGFWAQDQT